MIQRLQLQNWRAYDSLDLELGPGATFVVASNGIGKTSLIMGAAWGVFGEASGVDAAEQIRGDADGATVTIDLRLPSGVDATIVRTIARRGRPKVEVALPDRSLSSQEELDALLASEFGADPRVLAQLTVMIHGGALETSHGEFDLQDHLAGVFGVTPLFEAARAARARADAAASALRKLKTSQRTERRARDEIVAEMASIDEQLVAAREERDRAAAAASESSEMVKSGEEWVRFKTGMAERTMTLELLAEQAASLLERPVTSETLMDVLVEMEGDLLEAISAAEREAAAAKGKVELITTAVGQLRTSDAACPTCLRPLSEHEAGRAEEEHRKHIEELEAAIADADATAGGSRAALGGIKTLLEHIRALPMPLEPDSEVDEAALAEARAGLERHNAQVQDLTERVGTLTAMKQSLEAALQAAEEDARQIREAEDLYREEAIGLAAEEAFRATGNAITKDYIEPLAREIEARWKRMFGSGGLSLSPEGHITRQVGGRTLEFGSLSGGEKVWALLLTRLLIAGASTRAPFVWLDEPLEHLDPRLRKVVAGTLAKASSGAGLRQVIVTTYESGLARQLMEDVPSASLIYVTSSG
jgi:DNA repair exonuclease SbcCD ATPase subunit